MCMYHQNMCFCALRVLCTGGAEVVLSQLIRHCVCNGQLTTLQEVPPPQHCIAIGHHHTAMGTSALAPPPVKMPLPPLCCIEQNVSSRCHVLRQRCCILAIHDPAFSEAWRLWSNFVFRSDMWHCQTVKIWLYPCVEDRGKSREQRDWIFHLADNSQVLVEYYAQLHCPFYSFLSL